MATTIMDQRIFDWTVQLGEYRKEMQYRNMDNQKYSDLSLGEQIDASVVCLPQLKKDDIIELRSKLNSVYKETLYKFGSIVESIPSEEKRKFYEEQCRFTAAGYSSLIDRLNILTQCKDLYKEADEIVSEAITLKYCAQDEKLKCSSEDCEYLSKKINDVVYRIIDLFDHKSPDIKCKMFGLLKEQSFKHITESQENVNELKLKKLLAQNLDSEADFKLKKLSRLDLLKNEQSSQGIRKRTVRTQSLKEVTSQILYEFLEEGLSELGLLFENYRQSFGEGESSWAMGQMDPMVQQEPEMQKQVTQIQKKAEENTQKDREAIEVRIKEIIEICMSFVPSQGDAAATDNRETYERFCNRLTEVKIVCHKRGELPCADVISELLGRLEKIKRRQRDNYALHTKMIGSVTSLDSLKERLELIIAQKHLDRESKELFRIRLFESGERDGLDFYGERGIYYFIEEIEREKKDLTMGKEYPFKDKLVLSIPAIDRMKKYLQSKEGVQAVPTVQEPEEIKDCQRLNDASVESEVQPMPHMPHKDILEQLVQRHLSRYSTTQNPSG